MNRAYSVQEFKNEISIDQVIGRYVALKKSGAGELVGLCPFHDEKTPSFTVTPSKGAYFCFGCQAGGDVIKFVQEVEGKSFTEAKQALAGMVGMDLPGKQAIRPPAPVPQVEPKLVATYPYVDECGELLYEVQRWEPGRNSKAKDFRQRRKHEGAWVYGISKGKYRLRNGSWFPTKSEEAQSGDIELSEVRRVLWRLPEVLGSYQVVLVEGEKDVLTLEGLGYVATTVSGGSQSAWLPEFTEALRGKRVILIPDTDAPGQKMAQRVSAALDGNVAEFLLVKLPSGFKDVTDYVIAGRNKVSALEAMIKSAESQYVKGELRHEEGWQAQSKDVPDSFCWPDPLPLQDTSRVANLRPDILPGAIGEFAETLTHWSETPPELAELAVLGVTSVALNGKLEVEAEPGYIEPCNLFLCVMLESGNRKSSVVNRARQPIDAWEKKEHLRIEPEFRRVSSELKTRQALIEKLRRGLKDDNPESIQNIAKLEASQPELPKFPTLYTTDSTPEKLEIIAGENGGRAAWVSDEGSSFFNSGFGRDGNRVNLEVFLQGASRSPMRIHRVGRDPVVIEKPTVTVFISPQNGSVQDQQNRPQMRHLGLLARFLFAMPPSPLGSRSLVPAPIPPSVEAAYVNTITRLLDWQPDDCVTLRLSSEAYAEWKAFQKSVEVQLKDGRDLCMMKDWGSKLPGAALRISGLLHAASLSDLNKIRTPISQATMAVSLEMCSTLISHAKAVFGLLSEDPVLKKAVRVMRWIQDSQLVPLSKRDVFRAHQPHVFSRVEELDLALGLLEKHHLIRVLKKTTGGRAIIETNPMWGKE